MASGEESRKQRPKAKYTRRRGRKKAKDRSEKTGRRSGRRQQRGKPMTDKDTM